MTKVTTELPWVVFTLKDKYFALPSNKCQGIVRINHVHEMPELPSGVRGVIRVRGSVVPLIDLAQVLNLISSNNEDFCGTVDAAKTAHKNWINKLEESVEKDIPFTLPRDPHKCKFGQWYYSFQTSDQELKAIVDKMEEPHRKIHQIADKVQDSMESGHIHVAQSIIQQARYTHLTALMKLLDDMALSSKRSCNELAILLEDNKKKSAVAVDNVLAVETLTDREMSASDTQFVSLKNHSLVVGISERINKDTMVLKLSDEKLLEGNFSGN